MRPLPNPERAWERAAPVETPARAGIDLARAEIERSVLEHVSHDEIIDQER